MEQIADYKIWSRSAARNGCISNLYLLPDQLNRLAQDGRLRGKMVPEGFILLSDEGDYDSVYFRLGREGDLVLPENAKPIMAELIYRQSDPKQELAEQMLLRSGFQLHNRCVQLSTGLTQEFNAQTQFDGYRLTVALPEDKDGVLSLWEKLLTPFDFHDGSKLQMDQLLERGSIFCIRTDENRICAAAYFDVQGKRLSIRHVVVSPEHQGAGLGRRLVEYGLNYGYNRGCVNAVEWVAEDNMKSLAVFQKFMTCTDRKLAQYVLK